VRGLAWVFGAILVPLLCLALERWLRSVWQRKREEHLIQQTIAYLHKPASETNPRHGANPGLTVSTAEFTDSKSIFDGLAPCVPKGDLAVCGAMRYEQTERNIPSLFFEIAYFHKLASNLPHDANRVLTMSMAGFTDSNDIRDGLAPCRPDGDLVVYDVMPIRPTRAEHLSLLPS